MTISRTVLVHAKDAADVPRISPGLFDYSLQADIKIRLLFNFRANFTHTKNAIQLSKPRATRGKSRKTPLPYSTRGLKSIQKKANACNTKKRDNTF